LRSAPSWDASLGIALPVIMGLVAFAALSLGMVRLALMTRMMTRSSVPAGPAFQAYADALAERLGVVRCRLLLCAYHRPLALTCGLFRPTVLLSTWMDEHLDPRELEAVLAHELEHVARRDYLVAWLATTLRDAFWYLPTSRAAYRQLEEDKEFACDDLVVGVTHRPLALASALTKVWLQAVDGSSSSTFGMAHHLEGTHQQMVKRIERLMASPRSTALTVSALSGVSVLGALGTVEIVILFILFAVMACGPVLLLTRWF